MYTVNPYPLHPLVQDILAGHAVIKQPVLISAMPKAIPLRARLRIEMKRVIL